MKLSLREPLQLRPESISLASVASRSFHSGILLLEHQLLLGPATGAPAAAKRARAAPELGPREALWYELARLAQVTGEPDILRGIFRAEVLEM